MAPALKPRILSKWSPARASSAMQAACQAPRAPPPGRTRPSGRRRFCTTSSVASIKTPRKIESGAAEDLSDPADQQHEGTDEEQPRHRHVAGVEQRPDDQHEEIPELLEPASSPSGDAPFLIDRVEAPK